MRYPWNLKNLKNCCEKHPRAIIILKMVNDPLRLWKENHSMKIFLGYFCRPDPPIKVILCYPKGTPNQGPLLGYSMLSQKGGALRPRFRISFKHFSFCISSRTKQA